MRCYYFTANKIGAEYKAWAFSLMFAEQKAEKYNKRFFNMSLPGPAELRGHV